jgi:3-deoxy-manno-octulosonate cytidylyltransferase (CMP-KDO synthetase)
MELGLSIWAAVADDAPISVDIPADLERARAYADTLNDGKTS